MEAKAPLDLQLQVLQTWYEDTYKRLVDFKSSFKSFLAAIIARADSGSLKIGLEEAQYEGPLNFEVCIVTVYWSILFRFQCVVHRTIQIRWLLI